MATGKPSDYKPVIDTHKHESLAFVFASDADCMEDSENLIVAGREFHTETGSAFDVEPPDKTVVLVLLCPGDDLTEIMDWVQTHGLRPSERVLLVYHPDCDLVEMLQPWYEVFEEDPIAYEMRAYPGRRADGKWTVAQKVGQWYNAWIYLDANGLDWPLEPRRT